jgi:hypothetical protein
MKIYEVLLRIEGESSLFRCDAIEYQKKFWLVPGWLEALKLGLKRPERIICLDRIPHENAQPKADFLVCIPIPKEVLFGQPPPTTSTRYNVIKEPDIIIRTGFPPSSDARN